MGLANVTIDDAVSLRRRWNLLNADGYYADDILGEQLGRLSATKGPRASPLAGFFHTSEWPIGKRASKTVAAVDVFQQASSFNCAIFQD
jgi:hypothetical protein